MMNWTIQHEYEGLYRYWRTHHLNDQFHPIDKAWYEAEREAIINLINHDPFHPTEEEWIQIERKHTYWRGCTC